MSNSPSNLTLNGYRVYGKLNLDPFRTDVRAVLNIPERGPLRGIFLSYVEAQDSAPVTVPLVGIVSQRLLPRVGGGRVVASEVMKGTLRIKELLRDESRYSELYDAIRANTSRAYSSVFVADSSDCLRSVSLNICSRVKSSKSNSGNRYLRLFNSAATPFLACSSSRCIWNGTASISFKSW